MIRFLTIAVFVLTLAAAVCRAQTPVNSAAATKKAVTVSAAVKSSPAYAELILRRTERESELEEFLLDYTDEFPKVKEIKFEIDSLQKELNKLAAVNQSEAGKLTSALGKLMVRKTEIETDLWNLRRQYSDDHPEAKRARRKIEIFERAIREIL